MQKANFSFFKEGSPLNRVTAKILTSKDRGTGVSPSSARFLVAIAGIFGGLLFLFQPSWQGVVEAQQNRQANTGPTPNPEQPSHGGYVGSAACARCHMDQYTTFSRTRMGRSLTPVTPDLIKTLSLPDSTYSQNPDRHFETFSKDGKLYQSEYQTSTDGRDIFRNTREVNWIMGAGQNGFGALVKRGDFLFEAPLSFYAKTERWELSPGYETRDLGFNRLILPGCLFCHSGRPIPLAQTGKFKPTAPTLSAIGCENCHGPGAAHILAKSTKNSPLKGSQIVNPGLLTASLENNICMSCHEDGDSKVLRPGKSYEDFRPGAPLDDTLSIFMVPRSRDNPDDSDHVQHFYAMSMSKCYRGSGGQLRCATCHDPHIEPTAAEAPAHFNQICVGCHAKQICSLPLPARQATSPPDNCIGCHMPRRSVPEIAHTSLTNHRILARPGEPWPEAAYQQTTPELPDLVHLNPVPGRADHFPLLTLLDAYSELIERKPEYRASYSKVLSELEKSDPNHASVQFALGRRDLDASAFDQAIAHFQQSLQLNPDQPLAYGYLSQALAGRGDLTAAITASDSALALDPYDTFLRKGLIDRLIAAQQYDRAKAEMEQYLEEFPEDSFMRQMQAIANQ